MQRVLPGKTLALSIVCKVGPLAFAYYAKHLRVCVCVCLQEARWRAAALALQRCENNEAGVRCG